jgi:uncharacterized protein (DUF362 family)/Pyruvate/2-oxoacid:ferredoxin oxidoreductase delta subunit
MSSQVALIRCEDYDRAHVEAAVKQAVALVGGMERFVRAGETVVVKPNLLRGSKPEAAIVTHPEVVRAVVRLVQAAGGTALIADTPGGPLNEALMRRAYRQSGWEAVAAETGATLNYDFAGVQVSYPDGKLIKRFDLLEVATKADCVITVPKLKTHGLTRFTGATKILFGLVPGLLKMGYHAKLQTVPPFSEMLLDLMGLVKPRLSVMDAVVGMEGKGPSGGRPKQVGAILASADGVALDVAASSLVNMDPLSVPILKAAAARGLTTGRPADLEILGDSLDALRVTDFQGPPANPNLGTIPDVVPPQVRAWLTAQLLLRPVADPARCTGCQTCYKSCPVGAISMVSQKAVMDANKCIRCYCCHELCPENAIDLERGTLGRLLIRGGS